MTLALWVLALLASACAIFGFAIGIAVAAAVLSPFISRSL